MNKSLWMLGAAAVLMMGMHAARADDKKMPHAMTAGAAHKSDQQLIASAMRAAPKKVAARATIVVAEAEGKMRTLRRYNKRSIMMAIATTEAISRNQIGQPAA